MEWEWVGGSYDRKDEGEQLYSKIQKIFVDECFKITNAKIKGKTNNLYCNEPFKQLKLNLRRFFLSNCTKTHANKYIYIAIDLKAPSRRRGADFCIIFRIFRKAFSFLALSREPFALNHDRPRSLH